jgi:hypothetical protein
MSPGRNVRPFSWSRRGRPEVAAVGQTITVRRARVTFPENMRNVVTDVTIDCHAKRDSPHAS